MTERLSDEQVETFLRDPLWPNKGNVDTARHLAREVQASRREIAELDALLRANEIAFDEDTKYAVRENKRLADELARLRALIPEVIEQLETRVRPWLATTGAEEELDAIIAKLREASQ